MVSCTPRRAFFCRMLYACVGVLIGISVCAVFGVVFNNYAASILGLTSALLSLLCLLQFIYLYMMSEHTPPQACHTFQIPILLVFGGVGALGIGAGVGTFITFLGLGIIDSLNHDRVDLPRSYFLACVWAFANFKWGLTAFLYTLSTFRKVYRNRFQHLVEDVECDDSPDLSLAHTQD